MSKILVIVESPVKAKTINKYLGNNYIVKSSLGHIRDLSKQNNHSFKKYKNLNNKIKKINKNKNKTLINKIGIDPYCDWKAKYEILPGKEKIINELKLIASSVEHIYLATDLDREGEAIAWHLREVIGGNNKRFSRIIFNEITKKSIDKAFNNPFELNINKVNAQQARRFLDRIVGYMLSPLLWKKVARGLSAGRVQSVAVRLIVEKERKIKKFILQKYWKIYVELLTIDALLIKMELTHKNNKYFKIINELEIDSIIKLLKNSNFKIYDLKNNLIINKSNPPFITSTLQQAAYTNFGFSIKKTMLIAQKLYEMGYITYIRTDSTNLSQDSLNMARHYIYHNFGDKYLPKKNNIYINKKGSQEAHEAIRPSNINININNIKNIEEDEKKIYQLIFNQFIACQMTPAKFNIRTIIVKAGILKLKSKERILIFDGWTKIIPKLYTNNNKILQMIKIGNKLKLNKLYTNEYFTKPPTRFKETSLVKELEKLGIGRPSTYPIIISTIQSRGYVKINNQYFYAEKIGEIVTDRLNENFSELMNYDFTAIMEDKFDLIANGHIEWKSVLNNFFTTFIKQLKIANKLPEEGGMHINKMILTSIKCPNCYEQMNLKIASTGIFLGCSSYNLKIKESCKKTINLISENELFNILNIEDNLKLCTLNSKKRCYICNTMMDNYFIDNKYKFYLCGNSPKCIGYEVEENKSIIEEYNKTIIKCDKCNSEMNFKISKFGKYMGCINNLCKNTRKIFKNGEIALPKDNPIPLPELFCKKSNTYFVLINGISGLFLATNTFPKSRNTRAPLVEELVRFKDLLPDKFNYLTIAPLLDPDNNKTIIKFNYKTKQQYISSEKNGKITGWNAFYINGKWIEKNK